MMDTWKSWLVQGFSGAYLLATVWTMVDDIVKALLGIAMLILVIFQIRGFWRKEKRVKALERLVADASARCPASSNCPLKAELEKANGQPKES